jgi:hypothetical protein
MASLALASTLVRVMLMATAITTRSVIPLAQLAAGVRATHSTKVMVLHVPQLTFALLPGKAPMIAQKMPCV